MVRALPELGPFEAADECASVFFFGKFSQPGDQKQGLANPTKGFLRF